MKYLQKNVMKYLNPFLQSIGMYAMLTLILILLSNSSEILVDYVWLQSDLMVIYNPIFILSFFALVVFLPSKFNKHLIPGLILCVLLALGMWMFDLGRFDPLLLIYGMYLFLPTATMLFAFNRQHAQSPKIA